MYSVSSPQCDNFGILLSPEKFFRENEFQKLEIFVFLKFNLTVDPFLRVQLQHTDFELEVSGDELVQGDHKTMG